MVKKIWAIVAPFRRAMLVLLGLVCVRELIQLIPAHISGRIVDQLVGNKDVSVLATLVIATVIVGLVYELVAQYGRIHTSRKLSHLIPEHVGNLMFGSLFSLSIAQQGEENSTYRQSVTDRGQNAVPDLVNTMMQRFLPNFIVVVAGTAVMLWLMPQLGILTLSGALAYLFLSVYHSWRYRAELKEYEDIRHRANSWRGDVLRYMRFVQASGEEKRVLEETRKHYKRVRESGEKYNSLIYWSLFGRQVLYIFMRVSVTVVGVLMVLNENMTAGELFTCWVWSGMVYNGMSNLGSLQQQLTESLAGVAKYLAMLDKQPAIVPVENPIRPEQFHGNIEFRDVSYHYAPRAGEGEEEQNKRALTHVSFSIKAGERIAIVGYTGSGKSTLVNALLRAADPAEGQIIIDGHDLRLLDLELYRSRVGMVEQEPTFFDKSLRFNLTFGLGERADFVSDEELRVACKTAGVDEFFDRLPRGFETRLGEAARTLSGGQRQRLAIARALLKNPGILIFDEATSSLDVVMENRLQEAMQRASHNRTTLVIAHRFSSIRWVEKILVMHEGRVVGFGTHDELSEFCTVYQNLIKHQASAA